jgi:hypothetical protein
MPTEKEFPARAEEECAGTMPENDVARDTRKVGTAVSTSSPVISNASAHAVGEQAERQARD